MTSTLSKMSRPVTSTKIEEWEVWADYCYDCDNSEEEQLAREVVAGIQQTGGKLFLSLTGIPPLTSYYCSKGHPHHRHEQFKAGYYWSTKVETLCPHIFEPIGLEEAPYTMTEEFVQTLAAVGRGKNV